MFYIVGGAFLLVFCSVLASDYRGFGSWWIQISLRKKDILTPERMKFIKRYRVIYVIAAVLGALIMLSGLLSL